MCCADSDWGTFPLDGCFPSVASGLPEALRRIQHSLRIGGGLPSLVRLALIWHQSSLDSKLIGESYASQASILPMARPAPAPTMPAAPGESG
jgi:hypothetical protein